MSNEEENVDVDGVSDTELDGASDYSDSNSDSESDSDSDYSNFENVGQAAGPSESRAATGRIPKRKVAHHNALERSRRNDLTEAYDSLSAVLTAGDPSNPKLSRDAIIEESLKRIISLAEEEKAMKGILTDMIEVEKRIDRMRGKVREAKEKHGHSSGDHQSQRDSELNQDSLQQRLSGGKLSLGHELASHDKVLSGKKRRGSPAVIGGKKSRKLKE